MTLLTERRPLSAESQIPLGSPLTAENLYYVDEQRHIVSREGYPWMQ